MLTDAAPEKPGAQSEGRQTDVLDDDDGPGLGGGAYILGPATIQNALLAEFIASELGAPCEIIDEVDGQLPLFPGMSPVFLFVDADGAEEDRLLQRLRDCTKGRLAPCPLCIVVYNVRISALSSLLFASEVVQGVFLQDTQKATFVRGVRAVLQGESWKPDRMLASYHFGRQPRGRQQTAATGLTGRETEILRLIATGAKNREIADALFLSEHTVKTHIYNVFRKINVNTRTQAVKWAMRNLD